MIEELPTVLGRSQVEQGGPLVIGWKEYLDFPEWNLRRVPVKIDTGAQTSALDVVRYDICDGAQGKMVRLVPALKRKGRDPEIFTPLVKMVMVRNSGGAAERRPVIETVMRLGPIQRQIRLTITTRSAMRYRILLGREALERDFIVDVSRKYLLRPREL